jgi:hypothetical protein
MLTLQLLRDWYARNPVIPDSFTKRASSPEENRPDLLEYRIMRAKAARFSTAC